MSEAPDVKKRALQAGSYEAEIIEASRAGCRVIWTTTREEQRAERKLLSIAQALQTAPVIWTITAGTTDPTTGRSNPEDVELKNIFDPKRLSAEGRQMIIIKDAAPYLPAAPELVRAIRDEVTATKTRGPKALKLIVFIDTQTAPENIPGLYRATLPLPDRDELTALVKAGAERMPADAASGIDVDACADALSGLDSEAARDALNKSRVKTGTYDAATLANEKKQLISSEALIYSEPDPRGLDGIGGLENLKADLIKFRSAISPKAREFGLPAPKGFLITGIPGTGKSLTAKAAAAAWKLPLIRVNVGAFYGKYQGDSENNLRQALAQLKACAPCIAHFDEIEKAFAGAGGSGETDGGTGNRIFGEILSFMQDREEAIFIIATANDISKLPPEMKRAGRFDRIFFVDTPNRSERAAIARIMARKFKQAANTDAERIASACDGYTGAEIEAAYTTALYTAFEDGERAATTEDVIAAFEHIPAIAKAEQGKLDTLRQWAQQAARPASRPETDQAQSTGAEFDIDII